MATLRWLHLTDLHVGMPEQQTSWPSIQAKLQDDLKRTQRFAGGPFDLVLFSGDLVQRGTADEYKKLDEVLEALWSDLRGQGSDPVLLAVPGNHDLVRPEEHLPAVRELLRWSNDPEVAGFFWDEVKGKEYRKVVTDAFAPYSEWIQRWRAQHPSPSWVTIDDGHLPGDFAATIQRDGMTLGIVGLNSAFLQLGKRVGPGGIAVHPHQLRAVCGGNPHGWADRHDIGLLMTHHPPEWLSLAAQADYQADMLLPQWFAAHVCGHLHEPLADVRSVGGALPNRLFQGASLFGLEKWEHANGERTKRIMGYAVARLDRNDARFTLRLWPRRAVEGPMRRYELAADQERFTLDEEAQNSVAWDLGERRTAPRATATTMPAIGGRAPEPPGRGYDPHWYVPPPNNPEPVALAVLAQQGAPVLLTSAPMFGKTTMLQRLVSALREQDRKNSSPGVVVTLDLGTLTDAALVEPATCMREIGDLLVEQFARALVAAGEAAPSTAGWVDEVWGRPGAAERRLRALFERRILSGSRARVVLALDRFERLVGKPSGPAVARLLRSFGESGRDDERWAKVRLLIAATGSSLVLNTRVDAVSELFSAIFTVHLEPFGLRELRQLDERYELHWSDEDLRQLHALTGGWPYICRRILFLAATGVPKAELLSLEPLKRDHCALQLKQLWLHVGEHDHLRRLVCAMVKGSSLEAKDLQDLREAGLTRRDEAGTGYEISSALVKSYFEERC
ncbi:AAA-like domain-containing protein [Polyangium aurulentum]|uniref:AAA-like domain-containing protein n=1 Tax=Polyangium aurulentum TaxID=2567896 RepID=UPI0010AE39A1|nr:AAA-like domain-containing protein [Polyangium aurulentum]UQA55319.1 AAA-like domain-containing protein [Polyangium aurulentum]